MRSWLVLVACAWYIGVHGQGDVSGRHTLPAKHVAISFDDGPNNTTTPLLLDTLKQHDVHASFFMVGVNIDNAMLLRRMAAEGHVLGSHTYGHAHMTRLSDDDLKEQIVHTERQFIAHLGDRPWFFRVPYGELNAHVLDYLHGRKYTVFGWDADTFDWQKNKPEQVVTAAERLLQGRRDGAIMLMHEYTWTTEAQHTLLPRVKGMGWTFSHPLDTLTTTQLAQLKRWSCSAPRVCVEHAVTRPWCECPIMSPPAATESRSGHHTNDANPKATTGTTRVAGTGLRSKDVKRLARELRAEFGTRMSRVTCVLWAVGSFTCGVGCTLCGCLFWKRKRNVKRG